MKINGCNTVDEKITY